MERPGATRAAAETYDVEGVLPLESFTEVPVGTNLLIAGPSMIGKEAVVHDLLLCGIERGEHAIVVTPTKSAERILAEYEREAGSTERAYVVDCSGSASRSSFDDTERTKYVPSPDELTGIGVGLVKCSREVGSAATAGVRMGVLSISTLLQYSGPDRVFNFLHTILGRTSGAGYLGVGTLDTESHDDRTVNTMRSLFDGVIELRESDGGREARVVGLSDVPRTWTRL